MSLKIELNGQSFNFGPKSGKSYTVGDLLKKLENFHL